MKFRLAMFMTPLLCCMTALAQPAPGQPEWGTILGRVVYDGPIPAPRNLQIPARRANIPVPDESLVVGPNGGLANVFVYLQIVPSRIHPGYTESKPQKKTIGSKAFRFQPHALALWSRDELELLNVDLERGENIKFDSSTQGFNDALKKGEPLTKKLRGELKPHHMSSSPNPWMWGCLLVSDNPYFCVTDERGIFCIPNLPTGEELKFSFWHERAGYLHKLSNGSREFSMRNGKLPLQLKTEVLDLGEFKLDPQLIKEGRQ
jgi:hypothetical protein